MPQAWKIAVLVVLLGTSTASAEEKPVVGLISKAQKPIAMDGKLNDWAGAFVTPVHVSHTNFANRGGHFLLPANGAKFGSHGYKFSSDFRSVLFQGESSDGEGLFLAPVEVPSEP
jgi:hypothetical protein